MNCAEFESWLHRQLDHGLVGDDNRMPEHCESCPACRESWEGARLLSDSIAVWREQIPEVDLVDAVAGAHALSTWNFDNAGAGSEAECTVWRTRPDRGFARGLSETIRNHFRWPRYGSLAAIASLVALSAISIHTLSKSGKSPENAPDVVIRPRSQARAQAPTGEIALLSHAEAAYDTLSKSAVGAIEEFAWIVIPIRLTGSAARAGDPVDGHWTDGLQHQWQPVQEGLHEVLDFLRENGEAPANSRT